MRRWSHSSMKCAPLSADGGEQDAVVGHDPHRIAPEVGEAAHQGLAVQGLELAEARAVHDAADDLAHVVRPAQVGGHDVVQLVRGLGRLLRGGLLQPRLRRRRQGGDDRAQDGQRVLVVVGQVVDDAGLAGVHVAAAQFLGRDHLTGGRLDQRRAAQEDRALLAHDDVLVAHRGHVGAARGARSHHRGQLGEAGLRHRGLVEEDPAEVLPVGEDLVLPGQERPARVDQVDAGQVVRGRDGLGPQVLLDRDRVVAAALDRGVVGHHHAVPALDPADAGDQAAGRDRVLVELPARQRGQLQERRPRIEQPVDPVADEQLAPRDVADPGLLVPAQPHLGQPFPQLIGQLPQSRPLQLWRRSRVVGHRHAARLPGKLPSQVNDR